MHQPQQGISASPHSLNGEKTKHLFGWGFFSLYFFKRRCSAKPFKREFLQLMHLLQTPNCFSLCWEKAAPSSLQFGSATWRSQCCWACGDAKICSTSSRWALQLGRLLLQAEQGPFLLRCNPGWSLLLLSKAGVQSRASCVWNIPLLPQLYSLGIKGNLRFISSSASHFCGSKVLKVLKAPSQWSAEQHRCLGMFYSRIQHTNWKSVVLRPWVRTCGTCIYKNPLKFPPVAAWSMRAKQLFCT